MHCFGDALKISNYKNWDELFSLNHVVGVLTNNGYKFTKAQAYYALNKLFDDKHHFRSQKWDIIETAGLIKDKRA